MTLIVQMNVADEGNSEAVSVTVTLNVDEENPAAPCTNVPGPVVFDSLSPVGESIRQLAVKNHGQVWSTRVVVQRGQAGTGPVGLGWSAAAAAGSASGAARAALPGSATISAGAMSASISQRINV